MKKSFILLIIMLTSIWALFSSCADKKLTLNNWTDTQIEVNLGDKVNIDTTEAEDDKGNKYAVNAKVTTKSGDSVVIIDYQFIAEDLEGYKIVYTAVIDEKNSLKKTVTVNVTDNEKPVVIVSGISYVYANTVFNIPGVTVNDNSKLSITASIKLYRVSGDEREEISFQGTSLTLSEVGEYVFVISASDFSGNTEVKEHTLTVLDNKYFKAINISNSADNLSLGVKVGNPLFEGNYGFDADKKRTALSEGAAYIDTKAGDTVYEYPNFFINNVVMSKQEFVSAMEEEGAYISVWVYVESSESIDLRFMIDWEPPSLLNVLSKNEWHNIKITKERIISSGNTLESYFDLIDSSSTFLFARNYQSKECRIYFDSIYVAKDGEITIDMPLTGYDVGDEVEINAVSSDVGKFVYEVSAGNETRLLENSRFTIWSTGSTVITVRSAYGYINASDAISIQVSGPREQEGALQVFDGEGDLGLGVKPDGINIGTSGFDNNIKRTALSQGSAYIDTGSEQYPNLFIENPIMSKFDFVTAMSENGAYLSMWVYVTSSSSVIDVRFVIDWGSAIEQITVKNQWVNVKLTKARILEGFASLEAYYDTIASSGRFMFINNLSYAPKDCRIYFDSIYVAKDGAITINMPVTEFDIDDEIEIIATSSDVDKFVYEVTAGGQTKYYDTNKFTPWTAGEYTIKVRSAYGNINALAEISITVTEQ
jgi:hypothetical protein